MFSVFELFKIGVGPSSSHTVGPMKAAAAFANGLVETGAIDRVASVEVALLGSLAFTGKGHATDKAVVLGLSGQRPDTVDPDAAETLAADVRATRRLNLAARRSIAFDPATAIVFDTATPAPRHPNTLRLVAPRRGRRDACRRDLALDRRRLRCPRGRRRRRLRVRRPLAPSVPLGGRASGARARGRVFDRRV